MWGVIRIAPGETFCHKMFLYGATQASAAPEMRQRGNSGAADCHINN